MQLQSFTSSPVMQMNTSHPGDDKCDVVLLTKFLLRDQTVQRVPTIPGYTCSLKGYREHW